MKTNTLLGMLLAFLCCLPLAGCSNDESNPLRFDIDEDRNNTTSIYFPRGEEDGSAGAITILGGDGNYTAQCDNPAVLKIDMKFPNAFVLYPQDWGEAHVTVTDGTGASIVLTVKVYQLEDTFPIEETSVKLTGADELTTEQQEQLAKEAMKLIPVQEAGGGYRLVSDDREDPERGTLYLYPTDMKDESQAVKGSFCNNPDYSGEDTWRWTFVLEGQEHRYSIVQTSTQQTGSRSVGSVGTGASLVEDVTEQLNVQYPGVKVFTMQAVYHKN